MARASLRACAASIVCLAAAWARDAAALDPDKRISQYVSQTWKQSEDGLPQNMVAAIVQTPDGYLWLASQEGIIRFDGMRFTVFDSRNVPAFTSSDIDALRVDHAGILWIGTRGGGLVRYQDGVFTKETS